MVGPPSVDDMKNIVKASYPSLEPVADKLIGLLCCTHTVGFYLIHVLLMSNKCHCF